MRFKKVYIEISNICNLQCSFCPEVLRQKKIMSPTLFREILQEVAPLTDEVCLHLMGEPLGHPQFAEILSICEEQKVAINLTTNGILLPRYRELLLNSPCIRQINFSLHSFKDNFPQKEIATYLQPILTFSQECLQRRPELYLNYRLWNLESLNLTHEHNCDITSLIEEFFSLTIDFQAEVTWKKSKKLQGRLYLHFDSQFGWPSLQNPIENQRGFCHGLSSHFGILADGTVVPCCLDKEAGVNLGKCSEQKLSDIIDGERAQKIREGFKKSILVEALCQRCPYINRFQNKAAKQQVKQSSLVRSSL